MSATWHGLLEALAGVPDLPGAACVGRSDWFDLEPNADPELIERAALTCASCPARNPCRQWVESLPLRKRPAGIVAGQFYDHAPADEPPDAAAWLAHYLHTHGPAPVAAVLAAAQAARVGQQRLRQAAKDIGVTATRPTHGRAATWALPGDSDCRLTGRAHSHEIPQGVA